VTELSESGVGAASWCRSEI